MQQAEIFTPFFTVILLTMCVWVLMYARRIPFIRISNLSPEQMTPLELARLSPPGVANPADNLKNLFETPTIFYALCVYLYLTGKVDAVYLDAAWIFAIFRILHSAVHCTVNIIVLRFGLYCVSSLALWFVAVRGALQLWGLAP